MSEHDQSPVSGGGQGDLALDMTVPEDRVRLAAGVAAGWKITPDRLARYGQALDEALEISLAKGNERGVTSCVRTMATLVSQVQHDEDRQAGVTGQVSVTVQWTD